MNFVHRTLIIFVVNALAACNSAEEDAANLAGTAQVRLDTARYEEAADFIHSAIEIDDDEPAYYVLQARIALALNKPGEALAAFQMAHDLDPSGATATDELMRLSYELGRKPEARDYANSLLERDPASPSARLVLAFLDLERGRVAEAEAIANELIEERAAGETPYILKARALTIRGDSTQAASLLEGLRSESGGSLSIDRTLLEIYRLNSDRKNMSIMFTRMRPLMQGEPEFALDEINFLFKSGEQRFAIERSADFLKRTAGDPVKARRISPLWHEYIGNDPAKIRQLIASIPKESTSKTVLARFLLDVGQPSLARKLIDASPSKVTPSLASLVLAANGNDNLAEKIGRPILEEDPSNCDAKVSVGTIELRNGRDATAVRLGREAVTDCPDLDAAFILTIKASAKVSKRLDLIADTALSEKVQSLPIMRALISAYRSAGKTERALAVAARLTDASPSSTESWKIKRSLCQAGDIDCLETARKGFEASLSSFQIDPKPGERRPGAIFASKKR